MMKRLLLGLTLLVTATAASAEWTPVGAANVGGDDQLIIYIDRATIRRNGNFVKLWDLADYKTVRTTVNGYSFLSSKSQWEFDCKEEKSRILAYVLYDEKAGSGKVVFTNSDTGKWRPDSPESIGETLWKVACGKK